MFRVVSNLPILAAVVLWCLGSFCWASGFEATLAVLPSNIRNVKGHQGLKHWMYPWPSIASDAIVTCGYLWHVEPKRMLSIFNEVFFFKMLCAVCLHQDFLQVTSIQGTQMRRRNGLGIFDGLRQFFGEPTSYWAILPSQHLWPWDGRVHPTISMDSYWTKNLILDDCFILLTASWLFQRQSASIFKGLLNVFTSQHWLCLCRSPLASLFGKFLCRTSSAIPLSLEKIVGPWRYNELNEPPFLLTHLGNLQWRVLGCREACKDIGYKLVKQ